MGILQWDDTDIDTFYLGLTYSRKPNQLIRDIYNFVTRIIVQPNRYNPETVYNDHETTDMSFDQLTEFYTLHENAEV